MPVLLDITEARAGAAASAGRDAMPAPRAEAARCFHCGRPNAQPSRWRAEWNGTTHTFCCAGCLGVARTIHAAGLDDFYAQRTADAETAPAAIDGRDEWSRWDEIAEEAGLVHPGRDGTRECSLILEGIHCGACVWLIESFLARRRASSRRVSTTRPAAPGSSSTPKPRACPRYCARWSRSATAPVRTIPRAARSGRARKRGRCCCGSRWRRSR